MKEHFLKPVVYISSAFILVAGELAIWFLLSDHPYIFWMMGGFFILSIFFFGMKMAVVKSLKIKTGTSGPEEQKDG